MDRLTFDGNFCDIAQCTEVRGGSFCENGSCSQRKVWERLKSFEDTEEQGRLAQTPVTNADRIRAMSNEELAVTLMCPNEMGMAEIPCENSENKNCCKCLLDWLNQPVKVEK